MIKLRAAYKVGAGEGRDPSTVDFTSFQVQYREAHKLTEGSAVMCVARVVSTSGESHKVMVLWDAPEGRNKLVKVFRESRKVRVGVMTSPYWGFVHCDCMDYLATFYKAILKEGGNIQTLETLKPKGTGVKRAIDKPGMCKHLMGVMDRLRAEGYIK